MTATQQWERISSETVALTRELAQKFDAMTPSPTERDLTKGRLAELKARLNGGVAVSFHWATATVAEEDDAVEYRMNGQYSSFILARANGEFPENEVVHLDKYRVKSKADLGLLFQQYDARKSARSINDIAGAFQGLNPDLANVPKDNAKLAIDGVAFYVSEVQGGRKRRVDDRYEEFNDETKHDYIHWVGEDMLTDKTPELRKAPVVAAMFGTFLRDETAAREFWREVAKGANEDDPADPPGALDEWLLAAKQNKVKLKPGQFYQACISAWTAFRAAKKLKAIKTDISKGYLDIV